MANTSALAYVQDANLVNLSGVAKTATFNSAAIGSLGKRFIGIKVTTASSSGTSPTLDITPEVSFDGGTTWDSLPATANSQTAAALAQITGNSDAVPEFWEAPLPVNANAQYRFKFTIGGTNPSFTITAWYWFSQH